MILLIIIGAGQISQANPSLPEEMTLVPEGEYLAGDVSQGGKKTWVKGFYLDIFEVTNRQFKKFIQETKRKRPLPITWLNGKDYPVVFNLENHPVVNVDWFLAKEYCLWLGKRLPTEVEWEKAARGPEGRKWPWGEDFDADKANTAETKIEGTLPVGSFPEGVGPYGHYDLTGNVREWTDTPYRSGSSNPGGEEYMVLRGGSFAMGMHPYGMTDNRQYFPKTLYHQGINNSMSDLDIGFRCAKDL